MNTHNPTPDTSAALEEIRAMYEGQKIRSIKLGLGQKAAVLIVDFQHIYTRGRAATGLDAVNATAQLLDRTRQHDIPTIYTVVSYQPERHDEVLWLEKLPGLKENTAGQQEVEVEELVAPFDQDAVIEKEAASAFYGTGLSEMLTSQGIDTLLVCGTSTSGCVRATVVDGMAHGFRMIVVKECVCDRSALLHELSLFDMGTKYGDVITQSELMADLEAVWAAS
jgi:maleamate amidohydrolase